MDTEFNRQGVALPRRTAHDQVMSDAIRQATAAQIAKHRRLLRSGRDGRILSALMFKPRRKCIRAARRGDRAYLVALHPPHLYGECALHLGGLPSQTKIQELHRYRLETEIPIVIDLKEIRP